MTDGEIVDAIQRGELGIDPYEEKRQEPCSYDARLGKEALLSRDDKLIDLRKEGGLTLEAGDFALVVTHESFRMPLDIAGHIGMKSGLARQGLMLLAGMQIDPGFDAHLRLGLYNGSGRPITVDHQDPLCTIEFHRLASNVVKGIRAFPELKDGRIPPSDKAFLRELETTSLTDLRNDMRSLTQSMNGLTQNMKTLSTITYAVILPALLAIFAALLASFLVK